MKKVIICFGFLFLISCSSFNVVDEFSLVGQWGVDYEMMMKQVLQKDNIDYEKLSEKEKKAYIKMLKNEIYGYKHIFWVNNTYNLTIESRQIPKTVFEGIYSLNRIGDKKYNLFYTILATHGNEDKNEKKEDVCYADL